VQMVEDKLAEFDRGGAEAHHSPAGHRADPAPDPKRRALTRTPEPEVEAPALEL
jgi:hypothetical protein